MVDAKANSWVTGTTPIAPSTSAQGVFEGYTDDGAAAVKELSTKECEELVQDYADAVWRAYEAGFDIVELHAAHGFLLQQFLSPYTNHRSTSTVSGLHS
ncbi:hypothetical protein MFMK1_002115 [Metallumcola ferriviriculae]|uniref:NADH:flavin oxidoreductase/NADH oxidase N-terminal domain-containing protein n=1 Tax=Metallumcola ferriviriculae TaxID=3039180 RepID=A0AAU0UPZ6_9FIRM|nr:hypothetical protein MFMK1_002115 [Desulfitibacteraceae bacterium MK1]